METDTTVQGTPTSEMLDSLLDAPAETEDAVQQEEPAQEEQQTTEDARRAELDAALNELLEDGWSVDELQALVLDEQVRKDIAAGKSLMRSVNAYERRKKTEKSTPAAKHGAPGLRNATTAGSGQRNTIAEMSDDDFNKYYEKTKSEALAGKKIRL